MFGLIIRRNGLLAVSFAGGIVPIVVVVLLLFVGACGSQQPVKVDTDEYAVAVTDSSNAATEDTSGLLPDTSIDSGPVSETTSHDAAFVFACTDEPCTYLCELDLGSWKSCTSPWTYTGLLAGSHKLKVWAMNEAKLRDETPAEWEWQIVPAQTWVKASLGGYHSCAIDTAGALWCWGQNKRGQLGDGTDLNSYQPIQVEPDKYWTDVGSGTYQTCAIQQDTSLWCWGSMSEFVDNALFSPELLTNVTGWQIIAVGSYHSCAIRSDHSLWCWGQSAYSGQLGVVGKSAAVFPVQVSSTSDWQILTVRGFHSCAIRADATLWCWGDNQYGQIGDGSTVDRHEPVQIGVSDKWNDVSAGASDTCGIKSDNTLWCWGAGTSGKLGNGSDADQPLPVQVGSRTDWKKVTAGWFHTCALNQSNQIWCWGEADRYQLGTRDSLTRSVPVQIVLHKNWKSVFAGGEHSCAIDDKDYLWCWGANFEGQSGGSDTTRSLKTFVAIE